MTQNLNRDREQELQEILSLAKEAEDKLKQMSNFATTVVERHEGWYKARLGKNVSPTANNELNI